MKQEIGDVGIVTIDKPRVLQIVINLIRNSSEALAASGQEKKLITIRCYKHEKNSLRIEVLDNGVGIPLENLTKIFHHGFTTKDKGQSIFESNLKPPIFVIIGGEKRGIEQALLYMADLQCTIPYKRDFLGSLPLSSAATIIGFEILRQRDYSQI